MKPKKYNFFDKPKKFGMSDYEQAKANIVAYLSKIPEVISVYEYGSVNHPGFSDLDIALVLKDELKESAPEDFENTNFDKITQEVMMSPLVIMNEHSFSNLSKVMLVDRVSKLYGKGIKIHKLNKQDKSAVELALLIEFLPDRIFHLTNYTISKRIPIRFSIGVCYSLKYSIHIIESLTSKQKDNWHVYVDKVNYLRKNWFDIGNKKYADLVECIDEGLTISYEILQELTHYLMKHNCYPIDPKIENSVFYQGTNKLIFFSRNLKNPDQELSLKLTRKLKGSRIIQHLNRLHLFNQYALCLPLIYCPHYLYYLNSKGIVTNALFDSFIPKPKKNSINILGVNKKIGDILNERIQISNRYADFLKTNNFSAGSFIHTGFVYSRTRSFKKNIANLFASAIYALNKRKARTILKKSRWGFR